MAAFSAAVALCDDYPLAHANLGNALLLDHRPGEPLAVLLRAAARWPEFADAHYNLALAHERRGERRTALRHWQTYARLDKQGPWADHARVQIRRLLGREKLAIAWRAGGYVPRRKGLAALELVGPAA